MPLALLGAAYDELGREEEREAALAGLTAASRATYVPAYQIAVVHVGRGDKEGAFEWLERTYQERSEVLGWLRVDPFWDTIRSDARFEDLARRVGLPPAPVSGRVRPA